MLRAKEDLHIEDQIMYTVSGVNILFKGMISLCQLDKETDVRQKVASALKSHLSLLLANDFEFVKANKKTISTINLTETMEYEFAHFT